MKIRFTQTKKFFNKYTIDFEYVIEEDKAFWGSTKFSAGDDRAGNLSTNSTNLRFNTLGARFF